MTVDEALCCLWRLLRTPLLNDHARLHVAWIEHNNGEAGSSSDQKKVEPQPAEEGTKRRLPDKTTPPTPPPRPPKTARKA
jgi:hypothetical protein